MALLKAAFLSSIWLNGLVAAALPPGTVEIEVFRVNDQTGYAIQMEIGTPPQNMSVQIDTGSPFMGLAGTNSNWCKLPKKPCALYGSYNNYTSTTAKYVDSQFNNILINHGFGDDINDVVRVGGQTFPKTTFGMITDYEASFPAPDTVIGLVGLTPICLKKTTCATPTTTLQQHLIKKGRVKRNAVSVYLGPEEADARGQVLFGAVDRAKQLGKPVTFPVIPPSNFKANNSPNLAPFSSIAISRVPSSGTSPSITHYNISKNSYGILDTGTPDWAMPTAAYNVVSKYLGIKPSGKVDCKFRNAQQDHAKLVVGFANDTLKINVPFERLVTQRGPNDCFSAIGYCDDGEGCAFGDVFLRNVYFTLDFENFTATMSNVKYTNATNIVAL